ncbi:MAG: 50S ribosomal protein L25 [Candidatus Spechtbacteria bacterium]|nr:50S ribosomal protein L25 [Candidatus Spechtbacteria bacterium]
MISLQATIRTTLGKKSKRLRKDGLIPAVLYGKKVKSTAVAVGYKEFTKVYREAGESTLVSLVVTEKEQGAEKENAVLLRAPIRHPLTKAFMHVDFYQVPMDEEIRISIPLLFENESPLVKNGEAVLAKNIYTLEVSALPKDLPHEIKVDLSKLQTIDDMILGKDLVLPRGVRLALGENFVIASLTLPEAEEVAAEAVSEVAPTEIKTEGEEKRAEKAKEAAAEAEAEGTKK